FDSQFARAAKPWAQVAWAKFWIDCCHVERSRDISDLVISRDSSTPLRFAQNDSYKYASSSIGRVAVSKTVGWGFESLLAWIKRRQMPNIERRTLNRSEE